MVVGWGGLGGGLDLVVGRGGFGVGLGLLVRWCGFGGINAWCNQSSDFCGVCLLSDGEAFARGVRSVRNFFTRFYV